MEDSIKAKVRAIKKQQEEARKITALEAEKLKAQPPRDSRSLSDFKGDYVPMTKQPLAL